MLYPEFLGFRYLHARIHATHQMYSSLPGLHSKNIMWIMSEVPILRGKSYQYLNRCDTWNMCRHFSNMCRHFSPCESYPGFQFYNEKAINIWTDVTLAMCADISHHVNRIRGSNPAEQKVSISGSMWHVQYVRTFLIMWIISEVPILQWKGYQYLDRCDTLETAKGAHISS